MHQRGKFVPFTPNAARRIKEDRLYLHIAEICCLSETDWHVVVQVRSLGGMQPSVITASSEEAKRMLSELPACWQANRGAYERLIDAVAVYHRQVKGEQNRAVVVLSALDS